jgi:hypothetical protein
LRQRLPRPFVGELLVTAVLLEANGVCGLRRRAFVAEGLQVCYQPALRLPVNESGLEQAEALLAAAPGMIAAPTAVSFGTERTDAELRLVAGPVVHTLRVVPPRLRVRVEPEPGSGGTPSPWYGNGALTLSRYELSRGRALRLDYTGDTPERAHQGASLFEALNPSEPRLPNELLSREEMRQSARPMPLRVRRLAIRGGAPTGCDGCGARGAGTVRLFESGNEAAAAVLATAIYLCG